MQKKKKKATIFDVADKANVAISTVSRVINDSPLVKDDTKERVREAIRELNFQPNRTAKSLAQKNSVPVITIAVPSFTTRFYTTLLKGAKSGMSGFKADMLIFDRGFDPGDEHLLEFLDRGAVDGLLLAGSEVSPAVERKLAIMNVPVVVVGTKSELFDSFRWNNRHGVKMAVEHLIAQGHKTIGMIAAQSYNVNAQTRLEVFKETIEAAGLTYYPNFVKTGNSDDAGFSEEAGYEAMTAMLAESERASAVFCASDVQAIGAWKAIQEAGLQIPQDIALIGYDNVKGTEFIGLSSVDQKMYDVGKQVMELLVARMNGSDEPQVEVEIIPELVPRKSTEKRL